MATNQNYGEVFCEACRHGNDEKVPHCIGLEVDVNCGQRKPGLIEASHNNQYQVVDLLRPGIAVT